MECGYDCRAQKFRNDFGLRIRSGGLLKSGRAATGTAPHAAVPVASYKGTAFAHPQVS